MLPRKVAFSVMVMLILLTSAYTKVSPNQNQSPAHVFEACQVNVNPERNRARFTAGGNLLQMRLEIYSSDGRRVFAGECTAGESIEWPAEGGAVSQGEYHYIITSKDAQGLNAGQGTGTIVVRERGR